MGGICCRRKFHVMLNGLKGSGKTTILYRLYYGQKITTTPTIVNLETVKYKRARLVTKDIGGSQDNRHKYKHHYNGLDAFVFVVDSSDKNQIGSATKELRIFVKEKSLKNVVFVVVANKQDLPGALTPVQIYELMDIDTIRETHNCEVFGTVATSGEGLNQMLDWMLDAEPIKQKEEECGD